MKKLAALALLLVLAASVFGAYSSFRGLGAGFVAVGIATDRAGLSMNPGAMVKMNGVEVGRVATVSSTESGAVLELRLTPDAAESVPSDVRADIVSTTVFGAKFVTLSAPVGPVLEPIRDGAVITADNVTVETNTVFESLTSVLGAVEPHKLESTLGSLSTALRGRGEVIGGSIDDSAEVLAALAPRVSAMQNDITATADTAEIYAQAAPDLLSTLENLTTTADTISSTSEVLDRLLAGLTVLGGEADAVLAENEHGIETVLDLLRPTTSLLAEYSPGLTCFIQGVDVARGLAEPVSGGNGRSMLLNSTFLLGTAPYTYEENLPVVAATGGPRCGALPQLNLGDVPAPYVVADTGGNDFDGGTTAPSIAPDSILEFLVGGGAR
ncbi:hypothetical protein BJF84_11935 [Rhodococcus sp. CUA-806]|nr:hypothetical protein BJF84_11935 [Rhodococcus sp. CUA-806]